MKLSFNPIEEQTMSYATTTHSAPFITFDLKPGSEIYARSGSMLMKDTHVAMTLSAPSLEEKSAGRMFFGAAKRAFGGDLVGVKFSNKHELKNGQVVIQPEIGASVLALPVAQYPDIICVRDSFLAASLPVKTSAVWTERNIYKMWRGSQASFYQSVSAPTDQNLQGHMVFLESPYGRVIQKDLAAGEIIDVDAMAFIARTSSTQAALQKVKGWVTRQFAGEGLYYSRFKGPGTVWLSSNASVGAGQPQSAMSIGLKMEL